MDTDKVVFVEDPEDLIIAHVQPEVTSPVTTGRDVTGSGTDRKSRNLSRAHAWISPRVFPLFFLTIVVVQSVGTCDPEWVPLGAHMRYRVSPLFSVVFGYIV